MNIKIIKNSITQKELSDIASQRFGDMVKCVVDIEKQIMAVGGELHADEESILLEQGSEQKNLWGINIYVNQPKTDWLEFDSMINVRPSEGNRSRSVEDPNLQAKIKKIVDKLVK